MVYRPPKSPVKGRGGRLREAEFKVQFRFKRGQSKGGAAAICQGIYDVFESRGITVEDVLVKHELIHGDGGTEEFWASWENGEVW